MNSIAQLSQSVGNKYLGNNVIKKFYNPEQINLIYHENSLKFFENKEEKNNFIDFISFKQNDKYGNLRLLGDSIEIGKIDSHNFLVSKNVAGESKFIIDKYDADGYFAIECYKKSKNIHYIDKILSVYNSLR